MEVGFGDFAKPVVEAVVGFTFCGGCQIVPDLFQHEKKGGGVVGKSPGQCVGNNVEGKDEVTEGGEHHQTVFNGEFLVEGGIIKKEHDIDQFHTGFRSHLFNLLEEFAGIVIAGIFRKVIFKKLRSIVYQFVNFEIKQ